MEVIAIDDKVNVSIRVPREKSRQFKAKCALEGTTAQAVIEKAIDDYLAENKEKPE